ncbi:hypothetical protein ACEWY4_019847 [Coilia grayii]|uniref:C2H2-type domain-containing protein n=1 Tax=Coilia grayii TaxID=363190 RepID=A0ABD1JB74_9TELE
MFDLEKNTAPSPDAPPVKTYRCVACSATFHGLASLLVHQASHAAEFSGPKPPLQPTCSRCGNVFASRDLLNQHVCAAALPSTAPNVYTGDCGEDCKDTSASLENTLPSHNEESDKSHPKTNQSSAIPQGLNTTFSLTPATSDPIPTHSTSSASASLTSGSATEEQSQQDHANNQPQQSSNQSASQVGTEPQCSCPKCFRTFDSRSSLLKHVTLSCRVAQPAPKMHACSQCGMSFLSIYSLEVHSKTCKPSASLMSSSVNVKPDCSDSVSGEDLDIKSKLPKQNSNVSEEQPQTLDSAELDLPLSAKLQNNSLSGIKTEESLELSKECETHSDGAEVKQNESQGKPDRKKMLMKILANAYMNVKQPSELKQGPDKLEGSSEDVTVAGGSDTATSSRRRLRPTVRKSYNTHIPLGYLFYGRSPTKKPVGFMTRRYCPVVLLETRQKFVGSDKDFEGNYQCGQCKRLFSDIDKLVLHHALHRKERLKCCHRCKQFTINKSGLEDHICPRASAALARGHISNGKALASSPKQFLKVAKINRFNCPLCNNSYTRLYSLKKHKCPGKSSSKDSARDSHSAVVNDCPDVEVNGSEVNSCDYISVGVGTRPLTWLKKEVLTPPSVTADKQQTEVSNDGPSEPGNKSCSPQEPFIPDTHELTTSSPNETALEDDLDFDIRTDTIEQLGTELADDFGIGVKQEEDAERGVMSPVEEEAEIDVLIEADDDDDNLDHNDVLRQNTIEGSVVSKTQHDASPIVISDDQVKRFTCGRCHKSFTRNYGLKKHSKICAVGRTAQPYLGDVVAHTILESQKGFDCVQCGKMFNHIESLAIHKRTCLTKMSLQNKLSEPRITASEESVFVLPPRSNNQPSRHESTAEDDDRTWGIMSLPSVLPRTVTCECGAGFTCPRRLFEHLQMHAQESYICPHCGENLQSWMKYEAHLRTHVQHVQHPTATKERSQQYHTTLYQQQQSYLHRPPKHLSKQPNTQLSSQGSGSQVVTQPPSSCPKCFRTFKTRRYLLRHMRLSCHVEESAPKMYTCSRCGMSFLSTYTLELHMQSNTCTPSVKPMRCPVCVRSFTSVEGLKKHLVTHSQQSGFSCRLCPQTFSSEKELESHKKSAHVALEEEREHQKVEPTEEDSQINPFKFFRCNMCPRVYHSMKSLKDHRRKVHTLLGGSLAAQTSDILGISQNSQVNFFRCQVCQRAYHSLQSLKNHKRRVHRILAGGHVAQKGDSLMQNSASNIFRCQICQRAYPTVKAWRNHRRRVHRILGGGPEMQPGESLRPVHSQVQPGFTCQICRRTYPTLKSLKEHRRSAHRTLAGMLEPQRGNAVDVMRNSHAMVYTCQICQRSYGKLQSLKDHRRKVHHIPGGRLDVIKIE